MSMEQVHAVDLESDGFEDEYDAGLADDDYCSPGDDANPVESMGGFMERMSASLRQTLVPVLGSHSAKAYKDEGRVTTDEGAWRNSAAKHGPAPSLVVNTAGVDIDLERPTSPKAATKSLVYYTPLSVGEQLEMSFQCYRDSDHPEDPYHSPILVQEARTPGVTETRRSC
jgi:hypothetical protein